MARFLKKKKKEIGLSPDELIFTGDKKLDKVFLRVIDFDEKSLKEDAAKTIQEILKYKDKKTVTWLNVDGVHDLSVMEEIAQGFNLERMIIADVMNIDIRPKVEEYDNCIFISIKMLRLEQNTNIVISENLSLILSESILITFQERKGDVFEPIRERIRKQKKKIRNSGTDYLAYTLLDIVIDNYIYVLSILGEKIEELEENLILEPVQSTINEINIHKRELNFIRKNIKPSVDMVLTLSKIESDFIQESTYIYLNTLRDNIKQANETSDIYRDILSDQLNVYHTTISSKLNDIMKFLTIFSVIFIPLTFIAGIYGTNFDILPELHFEYSYFIMLGIMLTITLGMLFYFKKRNWF